MIWAPLWANRRICFYCDNQAAIAILSAKSSKIPRVMNLVWLITFQTLSFNFTFTARYRHIPQVNNVIADSLSCFQTSMCFLLAPDAVPAPCCPIPTFFSKFNHASCLLLLPSVLLPLLVALTHPGSTIYAILPFQQPYFLREPLFTCPGVHLKPFCHPTPSQLAFLWHHQNLSGSSKESSY